MDEKQFIPILRESRRKLYSEFEKWSYADYKPKGIDAVNSKIYDAIFAVDELIRKIESQSENESPIMKQFRDLKAKFPDAMLLFRCGDFYEAYDDDAEACAKILGITLTYRNNNAFPRKPEDRMAGFPYHALDAYLPKLVRAGKRIAICDQLEDPKLTKKLVKRGITEYEKNESKANTVAL